MIFKILKHEIILNSSDERRIEYKQIKHNRSYESLVPLCMKAQTILREGPNRVQRLFLCILPAFLFQCSFQTECNNFYNHAINEPFYLIFRIKKNRVLLLKHLISMKLLLKMSKGLTWYKSTLISNYCITNKLNAPSSIIP